MENVKKVIENLEKNNMAGYFVESDKKLRELLSSLINENESIGCGDSVTLEETGIYDFLREGKYDFLDKYEKGLTSEDRREIYLKNFRADTFISGTSAITLDGKIFNIDGNGSRVAPIIYGPRQVILVVGINKIVENVDMAIKRTRQIAAPLDAKRLNKNTPCTKLNKCIDCKSSDRICNDFVLITRQFVKNRIKVIIINKNLGY